MRESRVRSPRRWLVASALAVALAACGGGGDDDQAAATTAAGAAGATTVQVTVAGAKVETAERRVKVPLDGKVRLEVTADRADEVHVHGYDRKVDVEPGKPAVVEFTADVPGVFEVELEEAGLELVELQVQ